jgi:hypothetical protein
MPPGEAVLVLDLFCLQRLLGHTLDELGVEQLIFALMMDMQCRDGEIDVVGQERNPPGDGVGEARTSLAASA